MQANARPFGNTGLPVRFEITEQTRQAIDEHLAAAGKRCGDFLFRSRRGKGRCLSTRQYARLLSRWIASIGLDPSLFGTHSLRRTKATRSIGVQAISGRFSCCLGTPKWRARSDSLASRLMRACRTDRRLSTGAERSLSPPCSALVARK
jgi:hypothetical protein